MNLSRRPSNTAAAKFSFGHIRHRTSVLVARRCRRGRPRHQALALMTARLPSMAFRAAVLLLISCATLVVADFEFCGFWPNGQKKVVCEAGDTGFGKLEVGELSFLEFNKTSMEPVFVDRLNTSPEGWLELTDNRTQLSFAAWYPDPQYIIQGFQCDFEFSVTQRGPRTGDGIAFVVQNDGLGGPKNTKPLGKPGMGIGYSGLAKAFAIEFDMYLDPDNADPNNNHISAHSRGEAYINSDERVEKDGGSLLDSDPLIQSEPLNGKEMAVGVHNGTIKYIVDEDPYLTRVEVYLDDDGSLSVPKLTTRVNIGDKINLIEGYSWVGFTSSCGDAYQIHNLHWWMFRGEPIVEELWPYAGPFAGNTPVQAIGQNFKNVSSEILRCKFGDQVTVGTFENSKKVHCIAPPYHTQGWVNFQLAFKKHGNDFEFLKPNKVRYYYYPPPVINTTKPLGGPTTGGTFVRINGTGFLPFLQELTRCQIADYYVKAINMTNTTVDCNMSLPREKIGMYKLDVSMNAAAQFTENPQDFYYYQPMLLQRFVPQGGFVTGGKEVTLTGNFTLTPELVCRFNDTSVPVIIDKPMYSYQRKVRCISPEHDSGYYVMEVSGNEQQFTDFQLRWVYDANVWIWLIAGITTFCALFFAMCCGNCWATLFKFKDYRLMATKEYREMTGKTPWASLKDLINKDAEERRKTIQVLNMLKMKKKASEPKFNQKSRWGAAAAKALTANREANKTGWDSLLMGDHSKKAAQMDAQGAALLAAAKPADEAAASAGAGGGGAAKPAPGAAWGAIMSMNKDKGGAGGDAKPAAAGGGAKGWAKLAGAPKAKESKDGKGEWAPLL